MANKMAEFPGKLAIFRQKAASLREAARGGGLLKISKLRGGYFGYTPPPLPTPVLNSNFLWGNVDHQSIYGNPFFSINAFHLFESWLSDAIECHFGSPNNWRSKMRTSSSPKNWSVVFIDNPFLVFTIECYNIGDAKNSYDNPIYVGIVCNLRVISNFSLHSY